MVCSSKANETYEDTLNSMQIYTSQVLTTLDSPNRAFEEMMAHMQCTTGSRRRIDNPLKIVSALNKRIPMHM